MAPPAARAAVRSSTHGNTTTGVAGGPRATASTTYEGTIVSLPQGIRAVRSPGCEVSVRGATAGSVSATVRHGEGSVFDAVAAATVWCSAVAGIATLLGPVLMAVRAVRSRLLPPVASASLPGMTVGPLVSPALHAEGQGIIPGTVVFGLGIAAAGRLRREA